MDLPALGAVISVAIALGVVMPLLVRSQRGGPWRRRLRDVRYGLPPAG